MVYMTCIDHPNPTLFTEHFGNDPVSRVEGDRFPEMTKKAWFDSRGFLVNNRDIIWDVWRRYFSVHTAFGPDLDTNAISP